jgi:hypothetical protein
MFWLKRRNLLKQRELDKDEVREQVRQWIKIGLEAGIDEEPGENPPDEETLKDWMCKFFGTPREELSVPADHMWRVLLLKTGALYNRSERG